MIEKIDAEIVSGEFGTFRIFLENDPEAESPRGNDGCVARLVMDHKRYDLPQEDDRSVSAQRVLEALNERSVWTVARWLRVFHGATCVMGVRGYDHSGLSMTAVEIGARPPYPFDDQWDSGWLGLAFDTAQTREVTGVEPDVMESAIEEEVELFDRWGRGEFVGFVIEERTSDCGDCDDDAECESCTWEQRDSLWGIDDPKYALDTARELAEGAATQGLSLG